MKISLEEKGSSYSVQQEFDLRKIFGAEVPRDVAEAFGQEAIDVIRARTQNNKDIRGNALKGPYSEEYQESLEFDAYGKSARDVNMSLTGDMLDDLDILSYRSGILIIGWKKGFSATKAYAHQTGYKGHPTIKGYKREFFGLTDTEVQKIKMKLKGLIKEKSPKAKQNSREIIEAIDLLSRSTDLINFNVEDLFDEE